MIRHGAIFRCGTLFSILVVLTSTACAQDGPPREILPLSGAFLQYHNGNLAGDWKAVLDGMTAAGMNTVVIQYLKLDDAELIRAEQDPTRRILELADEYNLEADSGRRVRVFIGLSNVKAWHGGRGRDVAETRRRCAVAKAGCMAMAARVKQLYGRHASFFGWYIPLEGDNCYDPDDAGTLDAVHDLYASIARECRRMLDKPVALSVFFNTGAGCYDAGQTVRAYTRILAACDVQYLLLQDGVGERKWDGQIQAKIGPFFETFGKVCSGSGVELWGVAECFRFAGTGPGGAERRVPLSDAARLKEQLRTIQSFGVKTTVAFEFYEYLDPHPHAPGGDAGYGMRKALYEDYVRVMASGGKRP